MILPSGKLQEQNMEIPCRVDRCSLSLYNVVSVDAMVRAASRRCGDSLKGIKPVCM